MDSRVAGRQARGWGSRSCPRREFRLRATPRHDGAKTRRELRARNILVRHFRLPRIDQFLRITIGTEEQCLALAENLNEILQQALTGRFRDSSAATGQCRMSAATLSAGSPCLTYRRSRPLGS